MGPRIAARLRHLAFQSHRNRCLEEEPNSKTGLADLTTDVANQEIEPITEKIPEELLFSLNESESGFRYSIENYINNRFHNIIKEQIDKIEENSVTKDTKEETQIRQHDSSFIEHEENASRTNSINSDSHTTYTEPEKTLRFDIVLKDLNKTNRCRGKKYTSSVGSNGQLAKLDEFTEC